MIQIFKEKTNFKFTNYFTITSIFSGVLVAASVFLLLTMMNYGVDFRGGAEIQVKFKSNVSVSDVRGSIEKAGFSGTTVQRIGEDSDNEFLIKVLAQKEVANKKMESTLEKGLAGSLGKII